MFKNSSILRRLIMLIAIMTLALLLNTAIGWHNYYVSRQSLDDIYKKSINQIRDLTILSNLYDIEIITTAQKTLDGTIAWNEAEEKIKQALDKTQAGLEEYAQDMLLIDKEDLPRNIKGHLDAMEGHFKESLNAINKLLAIIKQKNKDALTAFNTNELYPSFGPFSNDIQALLAWHLESADQLHQQEQRSMFYNQIATTLINSLALIASVIAAILITLSITKPLKVAVETIHKAASGDVAVEIEDSGSHEIGRLFSAMKKMVDSNRKIADSLAAFSIGDLNVHVDPRSEKDVLAKSLNEMVASGKKMSEILMALSNGDLTVTPQPRSDRDAVGLALVNMTKKLRKIIGSIRTDVVSLTDSSQNIVSSVSQVAVGSSETAAAVTETTTTVEELTQTAQVSAEKAKDVLSSAEETLNVVKTSEKSLQSTIDDMNQINEKMRIISESIIKLSELSQTIGEIIDTVNDLAEQSNLLAVNASIEAAKAGEHGKGFGVVAQEIRTLAEQSKSATVQVRSILNDIQNATSAAVLATEQGSKAVEKGVGQSSQTNESMKTLVLRMSHVAQAANQIAVSSQQQLVAVGQVTVAMNNINDAAKQHVESMQNIENTTKSLNAISNTLKQIVNQYILNEKDQDLSSGKLAVKDSEQRELSDRHFSNLLV